MAAKLRYELTKLVNYLDVSFTEIGVWHRSLINVTLKVMVAEYCHPKIAYKAPAFLRPQHSFPKITRFAGYDTWKDDVYIAFILQMKKKLKP